MTQAPKQEQKLLETGQIGFFHKPSYPEGIASLSRHLMAIEGELSPPVVIVLPEISDGENICKPTKEDLRENSRHHRYLRSVAKRFQIYTLAGVWHQDHHKKLLNSAYLYHPEGHSKRIQQKHKVPGSQGLRNPTYLKPYPITVGCLICLDCQKPAIQTAVLGSKPLILGIPAASGTMSLIDSDANPKQIAGKWLKGRWCVFANSRSKPSWISDPCGKVVAFRTEGTPEEVVLWDVERREAIESRR